ncbi:FAD-dependent oxidoreductase [Variovorax guangxiensis]|uniref:NAD(P)/FAD-dependent oxidoreductase n=1 Tax=Variovorax guangxiensis TaxID=1775474 RepID=UPI00285FD31F|nr:FAD-dependent oxidoreductase [Variovorax guangxiensis]MDR6858451.1 3-phenylpropionate/trans-cinnamate dioxygenase ferredoxin reductase subunit [Variovorax guangxiensis]
MQSVVILGAGHAGFQCAAALRQQGFAGNVSLVSEERGLPYQRPPLSKAYLLGKACAADLAFRAEAFFSEHRIALISGVAESIDRGAQRVILGNGECLPYGHLVIATGSRPRKLPVPGAELAGVLPLQTLDDADRLLAALAGCTKAVVIGAGFIGLEFAASARLLGHAVTVLDIADRPMARVLSPDCAAAFDQAHRSLGTELLFRTGVERLEGQGGKVSSVVTTSGAHIPADLVLVGIGAAPRVELAKEAGLAVDNGIVVDAMLRTADPQVSAIGDVASFPRRDGGQRVRLESVQNATDQARAVAARIAGHAAVPYEAVPWFWSDQGNLKLQIAGLRGDVDERVVTGDVTAGHFSVLCISDGMLCAVESVNRPADHMLARRLLAKQTRILPGQAREPGFTLKML